MATMVLPIDLQYMEIILPYLIGYMLNWVLFGVLSVQVYLYYLAFPHDKRLSKSLVLGVYTLETTQTVLLSRDAFTLYTFANFVDARTDPISKKLFYREIPDVLTTYTIPILGGIVAFIVQNFYAYRLFILTKSKIILVLIGLGAILQLLCASLGKVPKFTDIPFHNWHFPSTGGEGFSAIFVILWGTSCVLIDTSIAALMMYHLSRRDSGWYSTHTLLVKLIKQAVGTGAVTTLVAIIYVICIFIPGLGNYWAVPSTIFGKFYANAMMVNFNHRIKFANDRRPSLSDMHIPSSLFATTNSERLSSEMHSTDPGIEK
ncbi:hypothetical protein BDZ94DRAFT_1236373 [Collybia nuda]|uniref:DUF6534 domain-containing protein n=1 Tax=Collybia nuda TaxID=64659 RepID=A0A9P5Y5N8_9AGAR|nr:hypothetical protein BDZ94DRAFT_1236373 [Collybia nuda]